VFTYYLISYSYNLKKQSGMHSASRFSSLAIVGVFLITIINVLIGTFNGTNFSAAASPQVKSGETTVAALASTSEEPLLVMQLQDEAM
jgi:hypothetical protein